MTSLVATMRRRAEDLRTDNERGTSLLELVVGMAIMAIFMGIFTSAIVLMTSTSNKVQASTISSTQTTQALLALDKSVRYAAAISTPGVSSGSGDWYVEFDTATTGTDTCTQLRIDKPSQQLQSRRWTLPGGTVSAASNWVPLASNLTNGGVAIGSADVPFVLPTSVAAASSRFQQLAVTLVATSGNSSTSTNRAQLTFTALNSTAGTATNAGVCQQWGRP